MHRPKTVLCLACCKVGHPFMIDAKQQGARVLLLTEYDPAFARFR